MVTTTTLRRSAAAIAVALLLPAAFVGACSSSNANPVPPTYNTPETGTTNQGSNDSGGPTTGDDASSSSDTSIAVDAPLTEKDGALVPDGASCESDAGCWSCTPQTPPEFLNQCAASYVQCTPFANATRLPDYDGSLPALN